MSLTFGSLFAGIGGIDLGLERAGWTPRWQVEWDPFCQHVLAHHWPDVPRYGDITAVDWSAVEPVDLIAGGFPCQPVSTAGRGLAQADARWLWPQFARAIGALRPRLILVENVTNLLAVNDGSAFGDVLGDLATLGYDSEWDCLPAAAFGAPHQRDRLWLVAYPAGFGLQEPWGLGLAGHRPQGRDGQADHALDGGWWAAEPGMGRVAHGVPARVDRLRALGNAVVPQVVEVIGCRLAVLEADRCPSDEAEPPAGPSVTGRQVPRGTAPDPLALALAAAIREIRAKQLAERAQRRARMTAMDGGRKAGEAA